MSKQETHLVFIIQAHEGINPQGAMTDVCLVEVIDVSAEKAIERAKKMIVKKEYRIKSIIEVVEKK